MSSKGEVMNDVKPKRRKKKDNISSASPLTMFQQQPLIAQKKVSYISMRKTPSNPSANIMNQCLLNHSKQNQLQPQHPSQQPQQLSTSNRELEHLHFQPQFLSQSPEPHIKRRPSPLLRKSMMSPSSFISSGSSVVLSPNGSLSPINFNRTSTPNPQSSNFQSIGARRKVHSSLANRSDEKQLLLKSSKRSGLPLLPNIHSQDTVTANQVIQMFHSSRNPSRSIQPPPTLMISNPDSDTTSEKGSISSPTSNSPSSESEKCSPTVTNGRIFLSPIHSPPDKRATEDGNSSHSPTSNIIEDILNGSDNRRSIQEVREKLESGQFITLREMYPNKLDYKNRPIKYQNEKDTNLNSFLISKDLKSITREIEILRTADIGRGPSSENSKLSLQLEYLEKRRKRLKYYKKLMSTALESWAAYRSIREDEVVGIDFQNDKETKEALEIDILKFDEEFRRWRTRMSSPAALPSNVRQAISSVDAVSTANSMVDRMVQSLRESKLSSKWKALDPQMEKEKLTEELIRWKQRWCSSTSSSDMSQSTSTPSFSSAGSSFFGNGDVDECVVISDDMSSDPDDSMSPQSRNTKSSLLQSNATFASSVLSSMQASMVFGEGFHDQVEVIIIDDLNRVANTMDSGFFLTSSTGDSGESDEEEESDQQIRQMLRNMLGNHMRHENILMDQIKKELDKSKPPRSEREFSPNEEVKFFTKLEAKDAKYRGNPKQSRYQSKRFSDDPRFQHDDTHNHSFEDLNSINGIEKGNKPASGKFIPAIDKSLFSAKEVLNRNVISEKEDIGSEIDWLKEASFLKRDQNENFDDDSVLISEDEVVLSGRGIRSTEGDVLETKKHMQFTQLLEDLQMQLDYSDKMKEKKEKKAIQIGKTEGTNQSTLKVDWEDNMPIEDSPNKKKLKRLVIELDNLLGCGGHGKVYRGLLSDTGEMVAVKKIPVKKEKLSKKFIKLEIDILRQISHKHLIRYMGCKYSSRLKEYSIVLEYADGGSLEQLIKGKGTLDERTVAQVILQTLKGLQYLHSKKIIHRDLKPANILITKAGCIKITDFGVSTQLLNIESMRTSCVGTPHYSAPEVIQVLPYSFQADIWSLGCSMFEMLFGHRPYHDLNQVSAMYRMVKDDHPPIPENHQLSGCCLDFLLSCWTTDWKKRPTTKELQKHPFILGADSPTNLS